ncbi:MAG: hypothetical protein AABX69_01420, partial [Nanoarchaeota archaeon]
ILVSPEFLTSVSEEIRPEELKIIAQNGSESGLGVLVIDKDVGKLLKRNETGVNWLELERSKVLSEKKRKTEAYNIFLNALLSPTPPTHGKTATPATTMQEIAGQINILEPAAVDGGLPSVKVVFSYSANPVKREMSDFVNYY